MKTVKIILTLLVMCFVSFGFRCGGGNTSDPSRGFDVETLVRFLRTGGGGFDRPASAQNVHGVFQGSTGTSSIGFRTNFDIPTMSAFANVRDAKVPANWFVSGFIFDLSCNGIRTNQRNVGIGGTIKLICETFAPTATVTPETVDANAPPSNISIFSDAIFESAYGMPKVGIYDEFGNLKTIATTTFAKGGLKLITPNLSTFQNGNYFLVVNNLKADGSWEVIAIGSVFVFGNITPDPPNPCFVQRPDC
jgi:hypothetical protein